MTLSKHPYWKGICSGRMVGKTSGVITVSIGRARLGQGVAVYCLQHQATTLFDRCWRGIIDLGIGVQLDVDAMKIYLVGLGGFIQIVHSNERVDPVEYIRVEDSFIAAFT